MVRRTPKKNSTLDSPKRDITTAELAAVGFRRGAEALQHLQFLTAPLKLRARSAFIRSFLAALPECPDPDQALVNLRRFAEARAGITGETPVPPPPVLDLLVRLFGTSQFLADLLIRYPQHLDWLAADRELGMPRTVRSCAAALAEAPGRDAAIRAMRREMLRLSVRRIMGLSDEMEMTRELSDLAQATLQHALDEVSPPLAARFGWPMEELADDSLAPDRRAGFAVIAMGKLGGRELNFSSDIDLIFIYSAEGMTAGRESGIGRITNHDFFSRLAEALIAYLMDSSDEGYFYRVDTRLRPDGETGPLARSIGSIEIYYETAARLWERLALLRARAVAGDPQLGRAFESMSRPLVFNPLHSGELILQIRDLKQRIDAEIGRRAGAEREIKRGPGGIRELEFLVQTLQMLHGAGNTRLWVAETLEAIRQLKLAGILPEEQARRMSEDYLFLRTLEHRLQMTQLRQTHMLPEDPAALDALGLACGCGTGGSPVIRTTGGPPVPPTPGQRLLQRWADVSARVHADFVDFFERSEKQAERIEGQIHQSEITGGTGVSPVIRTTGETPVPQEFDAEHEAAQLILSSAPENIVLPRLAPWGIHGGGALKVLRRLGGMGRTMYLTSEGDLAYRKLLPIILKLLKSNPQPEAALSNLESFLYASGAIAGFYTTFLKNMPVFELLMLAFGSGAALAQTLVAHPEFLDIIANPRVFSSREDRRDEMRRLLAQWTRAEGDLSRFRAALARLRRLEFLLAGLGEIAGLLDYPASCERLGAMAEVIVAAALSRAAGELNLDSPPAGFTVAAMGKLGAGELNYYSDLDLVFVWDESFAPGAEKPGEKAAALSNRIVELLTDPTPEGAPFNIDTRLRPEGQNAPLAPPLTRYAEYYASDRAQTWEFQSAMKLRTIAGDSGLGERLAVRLGAIIAERVRGKSLAAEITVMRQRMESTLKLPRWVARDFKAGSGGTVDLEFIAQYLQLRHLADDPGLIGLGPLQVFERLSGGALSPAAAAQLTEDYVWIRRLERRARLLFENDKSLIPASGDKLIALERACAPLIKERDEASLLEAADKVLRRNRRHFEEIVID